MSDNKNLQQAEELFSPRNRKLLTDPIGKDNPITVQVLGICSVLAITVQLNTSLVMAISVVVVTTLSNLIVSLLRQGIPSRIRIIVQLTVIATLVILVDQVLKAFVYDISKQLSVFVGLIITNCIIMGRLEAFAMTNKPWPSILDGFGSSIGYGAILLAVGAIREIFGSGTLLGYQVIPNFVYSAGYVDNGFMLLPPMALVILALLVWIHRSANRKLIDVS